MARCMITVLLFLVLAAPAQAEERMVPLQYPTIQAALDACDDGDTVLVLPGTYLENLIFPGKAITLRSDGDGNSATCDLAVETTVIDGGGLESVIIIRNGEGLDTVVEGFTLTHGMGNIHGGGISCKDQSSPTIRNNFFTLNKAAGGGGVACINGCCPLIDHNIFYKNLVSGPGGAVRCYKDCHATISNNLMLENKAGSKGGAVFCVFSAVKVINNEVRGNRVAVGGGVWVGGAPPTALVAGNRIIDNEAYNGPAGGLGCDNSKMVVVNNIIAGNRSLNGGGMYISVSAPVLTNNTITGNTASLEGGAIWALGSNATVVNSILWDNHAPKCPAFCTYNCTPAVGYSIVSGGYGGPGNLDVDPLFADPGNHDYHLLYPSPCRETGTDQAPQLPVADFEGDARPAGRFVDMGADEFSLRLYCTGEAVPGAEVRVHVVGEPTLSPLILWVGSGYLDPAMPTAHGWWYLPFPLVSQIPLDPIPAKGMAILRHTLHPHIPSPWHLTLQALVGDKLSNPYFLSIE